MVHVSCARVIQNVSIMVLLALFRIFQLTRYLKELVIKSNAILEQERILILAKSTQTIKQPVTLILACVKRQPVQRIPTVSQVTVVAQEFVLLVR